MVSLTGLTPLLQVHDMPRAIAFYRDRLGFALVDHSPEIDAPEGRYFHWAPLARDAASLMLNTAYDAGERPGVIDAPRWAGHDDVTLYIGCAQVDALHEELAARGCAAAPPRDAPYGMRQLHVRDPDGYQLCFQARL